MSAEVPSWLLGRWRLQRAESGVDLQPGTEMDFRPNGLLLYRIEVCEQVHEFELGFEVEGSLLRTVHGANGQRQSVRFGLEHSGLLELDFSGNRAWFARERLM